MENFSPGGQRWFTPPKIYAKWEFAWRNLFKRKEGRYGHGQILLVGDLLLLTAESGEIFLLAPAPDAPHELAHFRVFHSKTWNPPALAGELLLVRNDKEAACYRLPLAK